MDEWWTNLSIIAVAKKLAYLTETVVNKPEQAINDEKYVKN